MVRILIFLLLTTILRVPAQAADIFVAPDGDNNHPGSLAMPVLNLWRALQLATPGDTILLREGAYVESVAVEGFGSADAPTTIRAYGSEQATLMPSAFQVFFLRNVTGLILQGLILESIEGVNAITLVDCANVTLDTLQIANATGAPAVFASGTTGLEVRDCLFSGAGNGVIELAGAQACLVRGNTFRDNTGPAILTNAGREIAIVENLFEDNWPVDQGGFNLIGLFSAGPGSRVEGNTIRNPGAAPGRYTHANALLLYATSDATVAGNRIGQWRLPATGGGTTGTGMILRGVDAATPATGLILAGNQVGGVAETALRLEFTDNASLDNELYAGPLVVAGASAVTGRKLIMEGGENGIQTRVVNSSQVTFTDCVWQNQAAVEISHSPATAIINGRFAGTALAPSIAIRESDGFSVSGSAFTGAGSAAVLIHDSGAGAFSSNTLSGDHGATGILLSGAGSSSVRIGQNVLENVIPDPLEGFAAISVERAGTGVVLDGNRVNHTGPVLPFDGPGEPVAFLVAETPGVELTGNTVTGFRFTREDGPAGTAYQVSGAAGGRLAIGAFANNTVADAIGRAASFKHVERLVISGVTYPGSINVEDCLNVTIEEVVVAGAGPVPGILVFRTAAFAISRCTISGGTGIALAIHDSPDGSVLDNTFAENRGDVTLAAWGADTTRLAISGNHFLNNFPDPAGAFSVISVNGGAREAGITDNLIEYSQVFTGFPQSASAIGILVASPGPATVTGNTIRGLSVFHPSGEPAATGVVLGGLPEDPLDGPVFSGNTVDGPVARAFRFVDVKDLKLSGLDVDKPLLLERASGITIAESRFSCAAPEAALGIVECANVRVRACEFTGNAGFAIEVRDSPGVSIEENRFTRNSAAATVVVKGIQSSGLLLRRNVAEDNYPADPASLGEGVGEVSVFRIDGVGAGLVVEENHLRNTGAVAFAPLGPERFAFGIAVTATHDAVLRRNRIESLQYPGYVDLQDPYNPSYTLDPAEGGMTGTGILVGGSLGFPVEGVVVEENEIHGSGNRGIVLYLANDSLIARNRVSHSGQYGILLSGDALAKEVDRSQPREDPMTGNVIERNTVWECGWLHGGMSGIALFHAGTDDGERGNVVRSNISFSNRQGTWPNKGWDWYNDGMGIILDVESNGNLVYNNLCVNNEGAGIAVVKSNHCAIIHNTCAGNGIPGRPPGIDGPQPKPGIEVTRGPAEEGYTAEQAFVSANLLYDNRAYQLAIPDGAGHTVAYNLFSPGPGSLSAADDIIYTEPFYVADPAASITGNQVGPPGFSGYPEQPLAWNFGLLSGSAGSGSAPPTAFFASLGATGLERDFAGVQRHPENPNIGAFEAVPPGFFGDDGALSDGFWFSPSAGLYYSLDYPWIWLQQGGWVLVAADNGPDKHVWMPALGEWLVLRTDLLPLVYRTAAAVWSDWPAP